MSAIFVRGLRAAASFAMAGSVLAGCNSISAGGLSPIATAPSTSQQLASFKQKINHIVIIYQENWGFDSLFGKFPGANGYSSATNITTQLDASGNPVATLPPVLTGGKPDPAFAAINTGNVPVAPFDIASYVPTNGLTNDPNHNFYLQQAQIDGGKMDRYLAYPGSGVGSLTFGYYDATNLPEGKLAQQYVLMDNFHQSAFGGSFLNNIWAACACTPQLPLSQIPPALVEPLDPSGAPAKLGGPEGRTTPDGYIVNTSFTTQYPQIVSGKPAIEFVPPLTNPTLGDKLTAANVAWKFYSGGLDNALAGNPDPTFQAHHQSYLYFQNYGPGAAGASHIVDDTNFVKDLASGTLPAVSWVKAIGANNEHPGYANLITGQMYVANLIGQIQMSSAWKDTMIVVVYDEAGGHFDHVAPMPVDRFGPSTRVPAYIVSPFAKRGFIDHSNYEVTSILKTIELRFGLDALSDRDATAVPLLSPFDFTQATPSAFARQSLGALPRVPTAILPLHYKNHPMTEVDYDE